MSMTAEEIQARITKKESDIAKINKRIAKWSKGLRPEDIAACSDMQNCVHGPGRQATPEYDVARHKYQDYVKTHNDIPEADDWNKGPNIKETYRAFIDLGEANNTLKKYQTQLANLQAFDNQEKIGPLWEFLTEWEKHCNDWYHRNAERYAKLAIGYADEYKEWSDNYDKENPRPEDEAPRAASVWSRNKYHAEREFQEDYYSGINDFTITITKLRKGYLDPEYTEDGHYNINRRYGPIEFLGIDEEALQKALSDEKKRKYEDLCRRIEDVVGEITNVGNLHIGNQNGEINGYVEGTNGKATVETISAGGYAVQCFHYRVLVHKIA